MPQHLISVDEAVAMLETIGAAKETVRRFRQQADGVLSTRPALGNAGEGRGGTTSAESGAALMLDFTVTDLRRAASGICPACEKDLPPIGTRTRQLTCDDVCHRVWIERLIAAYGETRRIVDLSTGKTHLVPTRVILEQGVKGSDVSTYPEAHDG